MSCANYLPLISRLIDGELSPSESAEIEGHVASCGACRRTLSDWQAQGAVLRGFLAKAALDEAFVRKVGTVARGRGPSAVPVVPLRKSRARLFRWAPAIAAAVVLAFVVVQFFPTIERHSLGKVLNAGDRLEVRTSGARGWSAIAAGALIRAGDWIRNPERSPAQILLLNSYKLTLHQGALAQVGSDGHSTAGELALLHGTVSSEADAPSDLRVHTAAGVVSARKARFDVHLDQVALPNLLMSEDRSEILNATVLPVGGVRIGSGAVRLEGPAGSREIGAGNEAYFTPTQIAVVPERAAAPLGIVASLQPDRTGSTRAGLLSSSVVATEAGLLMQVRADSVPLKRLLETTTGEIVAGAGDVRVTGNLAFPVQSSDESIVAAIGSQLGLVISVAQQGGSAKTAHLGESRIRLVSELDARPEYSVRKSPSGALSFSFRSVAAARVFQTLMSENVDLPQLSADDGWVPITLEASELEPQQVGAFVEKELGLVVFDGGSNVRVVQVGGPARRDGTSAPVEGASAASESARAIAPAVEAPARGAVAAAAALPVAASHRNSGWWAMSRPAAATIPVESTWIAGVPATPSSGRTGTSGTSGTATMTGKITSRDPHAVRNGAHHLTWPTLSQAGGQVLYMLANVFDRRIGTIWNGYDAAGSLVAVQEIVIEPFAALSVLPGHTLAELNEGGHWETYSESLLFSFEDTGAQPAAVGAVESDTLPGSWEFETGPMGANGRLWLANPMDKMATVVIAVVAGDRVFSAQRITLGPHQAMIWSMPDTLSSHPELAGALAAGLVVVQATDGAVAADLVAYPDRVPSKGKSGEWVY